MKNPHSRYRRLSTMLCLLLGLSLAAVDTRLSLAQTDADAPATEPAAETSADEPATEPAGEAGAKRKKAERPKPVKPPARPGAKHAEKKADGESRESAPAKRAWLGIEPVDVDPAVRDYLELTEGFGVAVRHVVSGSPAEKAGLHEKDILLRLDDQRLTTPRHLQVLVATYQNGDVIELTVLRKGRQLVVKATLGESELPPLSMLPAEPAEFEIIDPTIPKVEPLARVGGHAKLLPDGGVPRVARLGQEELQRRIADYRAEMQAWMKQPAATRGPSPTLNLHAPKTPPQDAGAADAVPDGAVPGDRKNKVEINASGVKITGAPSITIGHGASIRAGGGVVKINNANGSVSVKTVDEKPTLEIHDGDGKLIYSGPYVRSDDMIEKLPADAQEVLKAMNLNNLNLLNIQVGGE